VPSGAKATGTAPIAQKDRVVVDAARAGGLGSADGEAAGAAVVRTTDVAVAQSSVLVLGLPLPRDGPSIKAIRVDQGRMHAVLRSNHVRLPLIGGRGAAGAVVRRGAAGTVCSMITPEQVTSRLNKEIRAVVRPLGFVGSRGSWTVITSDGVAQIGIGRSVMRAVGGGTIFVTVGISMVPIAWWEYVNWRAARWGQPAIALDKGATSYSIGFVETRQRPKDSFYHLKFDPDRYPAAMTTAEELEHAAALLVNAAGILARTALDLLRPGAYLKALRRIPDFGGAMWEPLVVLLAEDGPSAALDTAIEDMRAEYADYGFGAPEMEVEYVRMRAAAVSGGVGS
jgi:hypothetical protein